MIASVGMILLTISLAGCGKSKQVISVEYDICSEEYDCAGSPLNRVTTYPIDFVLPENHDAISITLVASKAGAFTDDISDALYYFQPYGELYTKETWVESALDLLSSGTDVLYAAVEPQDGIYDFSSETIMSALSGYVLADYEVRVIDQRDTIIDAFPIPIGKTTLILSSNIKSIEVMSTCNIDGSKYKKAETYGKIAYENVYELKPLLASSEKTAADTDSPENRIQQKTSVVLNSQLFEELHYTYGDFERKYGTNIKKELAWHGEYYLYNPDEDIVYVIETELEDDFALRNDSYCTRIECSINEAFPEISSDVHVDDFISMLGENVSAESIQSAGTSYYFAEEYTAIVFSYCNPENSVENAGIELDIDLDNEIVHSDSRVSIKIIAGG